MPAEPMHLDGVSIADEINAAVAEVVGDADSGAAADAAAAAVSASDAADSASAASDSADAAAASAVTAQTLTPQAGPADLTDSTTGSATTTLHDVTVIPTQTLINNNLATLAAQIKAINDKLVTAGVFTA